MARASSSLALYARGKSMHGRGTYNETIFAEHEGKEPGVQYTNLKLFIQEK